MIELVRLKRLLAAAILAMLLLVGLLVLRQVGDAIVRAATGADPAAIFTDASTLPESVRDAVVWREDPTRDGREMEPLTRDAITDAYARALAAIDRAGRGDPLAPLDTYLSGPALEAASATVDDPRAVPTSTVHIRHELQLDFYSDDGAIVSISAPKVELVRVVDGGTDAQDIAPGDEAWRFVMMLEDGNWRIHQLEIVSDASASSTGPERAVSEFAGVNSVTINGGDPTWGDYDDEVAADELDTIVELGLDSVRVFIAGPEFGPVDIDSVRRFLDLAAERDVSVVPVLFDGSADHTVAGWADDDPYLERTVDALRGHESIVMWDLKNEPDLDDQRSGGAAVVDAWVARTAERVRSLDPATPTTVGWSQWRHATRVVAPLDVVGFHHFGNASELDEGLNELTRRIPDRRLIVSEFGRPAWPGFAKGPQETAQAHEVAAMLETLRRHDVAGTAVWVLKDPDRPIENGPIAGRASTSYGLERSDGSERPVFDVVRSGGTSQVPGPSFGEWLRSGMTLRAFAVAVSAAGLLAAAFAARRRLIET